MIVCQFQGKSVLIACYPKVASGVSRSLYFPAPALLSVAVN
jgi:hypothetical protein